MTDRIEFTVTIDGAPARLLNKVFNKFSNTPQEEEEEMTMFEEKSEWFRNKVEDSDFTDLSKLKEKAETVLRKAKSKVREKSRESSGKFEGSTLEIVLSDNNLEALEKIARTTSNYGILQLLAFSSFLEVREILAAREDISYILGTLAKDKNSHVRRIVARNPSTDLHILHKMVERDDDYGVLLAIASRNLDKEIFQRLLYTGDQAIITVVALNPNTPYSILEEIATGDYGDASTYVTFNPNFQAAQGL